MQKTVFLVYHNSLMTITAFWMGTGHNNANYCTEINYFFYFSLEINSKFIPGLTKMPYQVPEFTKKNFKFCAIIFENHDIYEFHTFSEISKSNYMLRYFIKTKINTPIKICDTKSVFHLEPWKEKNLEADYGEHLLKQTHCSPQNPEKWK